MPLQFKKTTTLNSQVLGFCATSAMFQIQLESLDSDKWNNSGHEISNIRVKLKDQSSFCRRK